MSESSPVTFTEDRVPAVGIEETIEELVQLYGGAITASAAFQRRIVLPLRRGVAAGGEVECTVSWAVDGEGQATVTLVCDRELDAPKAQRVAMLLAGVAGSLIFILWPFFPKAANEMGALAWIGGAIAIAVYFLSLRRTSGGIAYDFLSRLARKQRADAEDARSPE